MAALIVVTPGPDVALVIRNAFEKGRRAGVVTALGVTNGVAIWTAGAGVGVAAVLETNELAFGTLKVAGAAYLTYLGVRTLISTGTRAAAPQHGTKYISVARRVNSPYVQGLLNNVLNPKMLALFVGLIPQFITPGPTATLQLVTLAAIFIAMGLCCLVAYSLLATSARTRLHHPNAKRILNAISGCVLLLLGLGVVIEIFLG